MPQETLEELIATHLDFDDNTTKGGNRGFHCLHCLKHFNGSQTRQLAHLLGTPGKGIAVCKAIPVEGRAALRKGYDDLQKAPERGPSGSSLPESHTGASQNPYVRLLCDCVAL